MTLEMLSHVHGSFGCVLLEVGPYGSSFVLSLDTIVTNCFT